MAFVFKQKGSKYWYAGWKDEKGKRINRSTKIENKQNKRKKALRAADEYEEASRDKKTVKQLRKTLADLQQKVTGVEMVSSTVIEYFKDYVEMKRGETSTATVRLYETCTRDFKLWIGKDRTEEDIDLVTAQDMVGFRNSILAKVSSSTANNKMKALRAIFSKACKEGVILEDPTASLNLGRKSNANTHKLEKRAFTVEEMEAMLKVADAEWQGMIKFGLHTGQRLGDIATLRWSQIDLEGGIVRFKTAKTGKQVTNLMSNSLRDHVLGLQANDNPMAFVHETLGPLYEQSGSSAVSNQFVGILADCGLREPVSHDKEKDGRNGKRADTQLSFHCLRVTAITRMHEAGIPAAIVEQWVGHDSSDVHKLYIKTGTEALQKASDVLPNIG